MRVCVYVCAVLEFGRLFIESLRFLTAVLAPPRSRASSPSTPIYPSGLTAHVPAPLVVDVIRDDDHNQRSCSVRGSNSSERHIHTQADSREFHISHCLTENCRACFRVALPQGGLLATTSVTQPAHSTLHCFSCYAAASQQSKTSRTAI